MLCEGVHSFPADVGVYEDKSSDSGENVSHAGLQLHAAQRVHAQIKEVQVGDVCNNRADLVTRKDEYDYTVHRTSRCLSRIKTNIDLCDKC